MDKYLLVDTLLPTVRNMLAKRKLHARGWSAVSRGVNCVKHPGDVTQYYENKGPG